VSASKLEGREGGLAVPLPAPRRGFQWLRSDTFLAVLVLSPSIVAVVVFIYAFMFWTIYSSLVLWNDVVPDYTFVGLRNFTRLLNTDRFLIDLHNILVFTALFLIECIVVGFLLAVFLDQRIKGEAIFRTIFLLPFAVSAIVTGVAWRWLMNPDSGVDLLFRKVGLGFIHSNWFADQNFGIAAVTIAASWQMSGYVMALYLAGLRGIPGELREAAAIDGAGTLGLYRYVIVPLLTPVTYTVVVIVGGIALRTFDLVASMTSSGPAFADDTPAFFMFQTTFQSNHFSQGAAIAVVMLILAAFLTVPYLININREVEG
jgi:glucose/mannose transport system permease protein